MAVNSNNAKNRILQTAEGLILQKGFASTSIEEIIEQAHITKGGFFYHFKGKNELALSLIHRYLQADDLFFRELFSRAHILSEDPLQQMLIFLKLLAQAMAELEQGHPGCLVAVFTYESQLFDEEIIGAIREGTLSWRSLFSEQLHAINEKYQPRINSSVEDLADMLSACLEGGILLSRILKDSQALVKQILQYRDYLRLLYEDIRPSV